MQKVDSCQCVIHSSYVSEHIYTRPTQWQIQGRGPAPPASLFFWTKLRPEGAGLFFGGSGPPPPPPPPGLDPALLLARQNRA